MTSLMNDVSLDAVTHIRKRFNRAAIMVIIPAVAGYVVCWSIGPMVAINILPGVGFVSMTGLQ